MTTKTKLAIAGLILTAIGTIGGLIANFHQKESNPEPIHIEQTIQGGHPGSTVNKTININR